MKNKIKIILSVNAIGLSRFQNVPSFATLLSENQRKALMVGNNELTVNHTVWGSIQRACLNDKKNMYVEKLRP